MLTLHENCSYKSTEMKPNVAALLDFSKLLKKPFKPQFCS